MNRYEKGVGVKRMGGQTKLTNFFLYQKPLPLRATAGWDIPALNVHVSVAELYSRTGTNLFPTSY